MEKRIEVVSKEVSEYFSKSFNVELTDSPQILEEYLYLEYENSKGDVKLRIPYRDGGREHFLDMSYGHRMFWIVNMALKELIKQ